MKKYILSLLFTVFAAAGLFLLCRVPFSEYFGRWAVILRSRKKSIRRRRQEIITGKKKTPTVIRHYTEARKILIQNGKPQQFSVVIVLSFLLPVFGIFAAILADNMFLVPVLAIGLAAAPVTFVHAQKGTWVRRMNENLKETLSVITNTYIQNDDIVHSFKSNLSMLKEPFASACSEFVAEAMFLQANIPKAIQNLKDKVDSSLFREWCDVLIQCCENKELKYVLPVIVDKVDETITVQTELDTVISTEVSQFRAIIIIGIALVFLLRIIEPVWFHDLVTNVIGKFVLALAAAVAIGSVLFAVRILRPVEYQ